MVFHPLVLAMTLTPAAAHSALEGRWRNPSGTVIIVIATCDADVCGLVQWASDKALDDARKGGTDPLVGTQLLRRITPKSEGRWTAQLFVPDINKTSNVELRQLELNQLKVTGCAVGRLLCRSQIWVRVESE